MPLAPLLALWASAALAAPGDLSPSAGVTATAAISLSPGAKPGYLAEPPDPPAGPTVVPGRYRVELSLS